MLSIGYRTDLSNKIKRDFTYAAVVCIILYQGTTKSLIKHREKKLDGNSTRRYY